RPPAQIKEALSKPQTTDPLSPALSHSSHEPGVHPGRDGEQPVIHSKRPDHLYAYWQAMRSRMAGKRHCWRVEQGPHAVEDRIACRCQTCWGLPWGTWH